MRRYLVLIGLPLMLTACIPPIPLPLSVVSTGFSGFAFLTSGKTTADHVLSAARDEDCVMLRVATGNEICREYEEGEYRPVSVIEASYPGDRDNWVQEEAKPNWQDAKLNDIDTKTSVLAAAVKTRIEPASDVHQADFSAGLINGFAGMAAPAKPITVAGVVAGSVMPRPTVKKVAPPVAVPARWSPPLPERRVMRTKAISTDLQIGGRYLVIGSFRDQQRAHALIRRFNHLAPTIYDIKVKKTAWHRVAVGPLPQAKLHQLRKQLGKIDGAKPWVVRM